MASFDSRFERRRPLKTGRPKTVSLKRRVPRDPAPQRSQRRRTPVPGRGSQTRSTPPLTPVGSEKRDNSRPYVVWGILMVAGLGLVANLFRLQVLQASMLQTRAQAQQVMRTQPFVPRRPIVDRNGDILAIDRPAYSLYAHPKLFKQSKEAIATALAPLLAGMAGTRPLHAGELLQKFYSAESGIKIEESISQELGDRIANLQIDGELVDGLELIPQQQRFYPQQDLAADIVGYVDAERKGQAGVENSQQNLLERSMPSIRFRRAINGAWVPEQLATGFVQFDDLQLQLTLDSRLQRVGRLALKEQLEKYKAKRGAVIVMDAHTGELLSLVSEPSYDPNQYYKFYKEPERFKNWSVTDVYEPGSTFKPINVAIALEAKAVTPESVFYDEGRISIDVWTIQNYDYRQAGAKGSLTVSEILRDSSNVGMVHIMERVHPEVYYNALERLGLGQTTNSDLPFEVPSQLKSREQFVGARVEPATTAFGQGFSLTAMQLVQLTATLANGGQLVTPHAVRGLFNGQGELYWQLRRPGPKQVFSPETTRQVLAMMERVVAEGTGKAAQIPGYRIGGKTGTAQKANAGGGYSDYAIVTSFIGILPVDKPRYVVLAAIDEPQGGTGGVVAAPVVKTVMEALIAFEKIPPSQTK